MLFLVVWLLLDLKAAGWLYALNIGGAQTVRLVIFRRVQACVDTPIYNFSRWDEESLNLAMRFNRFLGSQ